MFECLQLLQGTKLNSMAVALWQRLKLNYKEARPPAQFQKLTLDAIRMPGKGPDFAGAAETRLLVPCAATHSRVCFKIEARCISAPSPPLARMLRSINPQTQLPTPKPEGTKSKSPTHKRLPPTKTHKHYIDFL